MADALIYRRALRAVMAMAILATGLIAGCGSGGDSPTTTGLDEPPQQQDTAESAEESIENFGAEAMDPERRMIVAGFHRYLRAVEDLDFAGICDSLAEVPRKTADKLGGAKGCAGALRGLLPPGAAQDARRQAEGAVASVRVDGSQAIVLYLGPEGSTYQFPLLLEGSEWKAASTIGAPLSP